MHRSHVRRSALAAGLIIPQAFAASAFGASASIDGAVIVGAQHDLQTMRGPNGRAYIILDRHFPLAGVCAYAGAVDAPSGWKLEFSVEHGSFNSLFALAMTAYATGRSVHVGYDDAFGAGTTCRITNLVTGD
jgi:hypothetical protein